MRLEEAARSSFALRLSLYYAALFIIYGIHVPYFPVWLDWRGLSAQEIAAVTGAPFFIRLVVAPTFAMLADSSGAHRGMVIAFSWAGLALALAVSQAPTFWPLFLVAVPFALAVSTVMPLTETIALCGVRTRGLDYGRMRLWGSLSFIGIGFVAGALIDRTGAGVAIWLIVAGAATTVVAGHLLPRMPASAALAGKPGDERRRHAGREAMRLATSPLFLTFLLGVGAVQGAHAMFYTFGALQWRAEGISTTTVGVLWAVGVLAEVLLFAYSGRVVAWTGPSPLIVAGAAAAVVRWGVMALDPPLVILFPLQLLHALTYAASHLGAMHFISRAVPEQAAGTAQAFYATIAAGLMMGGATLASGSLYARFGGGAYLAMAALAAVGLAASLVVLRRWDGGALWPPAVSPTAPAAEAQSYPPL